MATVKNSGQKIPRRGRFGVDVSTWTFRCARFVTNVSSCAFRRGGFGAVISATSNFRVRERHNVLFGTDTLSAWEQTQCPLWNRHNVLFGTDTLSSREQTQCLLWNKHYVLFGSDTMSSLEQTHFPLWATTHFPLWKRHNSLVSATEKL